MVLEATGKLVLVLQPEGAIIRMNAASPSGRPGCLVWRIDRWMKQTEEFQ